MFTSKVMLQLNLIQDGHMLQFLFMLAYVSKVLIDLKIVAV